MTERNAAIARFLERAGWGDAARRKLAMASTAHFNGLLLPSKPGTYRTVLDIGPLWLATGSYSLDVTTGVVNLRWDHFVEDAVTFDVVASNPGGFAWDFKWSLNYGAFALPLMRHPTFVPDADAPATELAAADRQPV